MNIPSPIRWLVWNWQDAQQLGCTLRNMLLYDFTVMQISQFMRNCMAKPRSISRPNDTDYYSQLSAHIECYLMKCHNDKDTAVRIPVPNAPKLTKSTAKI